MKGKREIHKLLMLNGILLITVYLVFGIFYSVRKSRTVVHKPSRDTFVLPHPRKLNPLEPVKPSRQSELPSGKDFHFCRHTGTIGSFSGQKPGMEVVVDSLPEMVISAPDVEHLSGQGIPVEFRPVSRQPDRRISLRDEFISLDDCDYGRYRALISHGTPDSKSPRGFCCISSVWGAQLKPPESSRRGIINLASVVSWYTDIRAEVDSHLLLDSSRLGRTPCLFIAADRLFELTPEERKKFGQYLRNGGFAFLDNGLPEHPYSPAEASLRQMLRDSLGSLARFEPIPVSHPVYHCFFNFSDGPPQGSEKNIYLTRKIIGASGLPPEVVKIPEYDVHYLEGVWLGDRLVAIYSNKGYAEKWADLKKMGNNDPQLKMGVNMVVFALTQDGGIARMNSDHFTD
ncbi:DUF4159 domain-containing protein [bacterium]|nr:DUF4159 domain-containing protein [bacterium]